MKTYYYSIDDNQVRKWETVEAKTIRGAKLKVAKIAKEYGNVEVRLGYKHGDFVAITHRRVNGQWSEYNDYTMI